MSNLKRTEKIARLLAQAHGHKPDELVVLGVPFRVVTPSGEGYAPDIRRLAPIWTAYVEVAVKFLRLLEEASDE